LPSHPRTAYRHDHHGGAPLGLQRGVEEAVMEAAGQAVPLAEAALPATIPALERRKRRTAKPPAFERLVMVCTGANCLGGGSWELSEQIPATLQASKTKGVRVLRTACLGPCPAAPVVHVLPDDVWYGGITQEDGLRIAREHLAGGEPCDDLRLKTRQPRVRKAKPITAP
ncbi:MAG: (2Fe-2S) ferredoxin domain-containing protein, partial [Chloroflexi bacterium]|nr:(2Fe-2S) ferredoxin domain-containing protein [Chloroflexota bacterium]